MEFKIINKHSDNCCIDHTENEHYCFNRGYTGNWNGNEKAKQGKHYFWLEFQCNDPSCEFLAIIGSEYISEIIEHKISES